MWVMVGDSVENLVHTVIVLICTSYVKIINKKISTFMEGEREKRRFNNQYSRNICAIKCLSGKFVLKKLFILLTNEKANERLRLI